MQRKTPTKRFAHIRRGVTIFPEAAGKTIESVELSSTTEYRGIEIRFSDKKALSFEIESSIAVIPRYASWQSGNFKPIKLGTKVSNR